MFLRPLTKSQLGILVTLISTMFYGVWPSAMRQVYAEGANAAFVLLSVTFFRGLFMLIAALLKGHRFAPTAKDRRNALMGGLFQAISGGGAFVSVMFLPGPLAVVIIFTHTLMLLCYMIWRKEIKPDGLIIATTLAALVGLIMVLDLFHKQTSSNWIGIGLAFLSAMSLASRLYVIGNQTKTRSPTVIGAENFMVAGMLMLVVLLFQRPVVPTTMIGFEWWLFGSATLACATLLQYHGISLLGPFHFSLLSKLEPLFVTLFAAFSIGEVLRPLQNVGIVILIGSLAFFQIVEHRRRRKNSLI